MDILPHERQIEDCKKMIEQIKEKSGGEHTFWTQEELRAMETKLENLKNRCILI